MLHLATVYAIARICVPWLIGLTHDRILPIVTGRTPKISLQFMYSHLLAFSIVLGLVAGFFNSKLFRHRIVRLVWVVPVVLLSVAFVFHGPGMYPTTMILDSNFKESAHFLFGWNFHVPDYNNYSELRKGILANGGEIFRGTAQMRYTVPAYVGMAYKYWSIAITPHESCTYPSAGHSRNSCIGHI
jgi:hypothetical protein